MQFSTGQEDILVPATRGMSDGDAYDVAIQVFPDGTCGYAVNGVPVARSEVSIDLSQPFRVVTEGNSFRTQMLIGPVKIWTEVNLEYDWALLNGEDGATSRGR
ncbi:MAG: hypothetical protein IH876_06055 [Gemmatimonadetes bacterium]|nr:hypothetical protein [Gemmatimonadota bacterium]